MRYAIALVLLLSALSITPVHAAESYDNCTGFIDSVPAVLTKQGTWCLRADLSTAITFGAAIVVNANNITIDCNHFKLGNLAAGPGTAASGIVSWPRLNTNIRNCNVRGFLDAIYLQGGGIVVEDSRFEGNRRSGIIVFGDGNIVRRNLVVDTGGTLFDGASAPIYSGSGQAMITDNVINGAVNNVGPDGTAGILLRDGQHVLVQGNLVSGIRQETRETPLVGILGFDMEHTLMRDNFVTFDAHSSQGGIFSSYGVGCEPAGCACRGNVSMGPINASLGCADMGGNTNSQ